MGSKAISKILILEYEGILIHKDTYSFVVSYASIHPASSEPLQLTQTPRKIGTRPTYHTSLLSAAEEVSNRLLERKLRERAKVLQSDIDSLKEVIQNHYKKMEEFYAIK